MQSYNNSTEELPTLVSEKKASHMRSTSVSDQLTANVYYYLFPFVVLSVNMKINE